MGGTEKRMAHLFDASKLNGAVDKVKLKRAYVIILACLFSRAGPPWMKGAGPAGRVFIEIMDLNRLRKLPQSLKKLWLCS